MAFVGSRLSERLGDRFAAYAAVRGGKSRVVRALIERALAEPQSGPPLQTPPPGSGRSRKVTLTFRDEDLAQLDAVCQEAGLRRTEWLVALARRKLSGRPQFDRAGAHNLLETRRELRRISVLLRELVDTARHEGRAVIEVERLRDEVRAQLDGVRQAIAGNLAYWDEPS